MKSIYNREVDKVFLNNPMGITDSYQYLNRKKFISVIYKKHWVIVLSISIFINTHMVIYTLVYQKETSVAFTAIYYCFEALYVLDTWFTFLDRKWQQRHRKHMEGSTNFNLLIRGITLIPYYELYLLISIQTQVPMRDFTRPKCIPRYILMGLHLYSKRSFVSTGTGTGNDVIAVVVKQLFFLTSCITLFSTTLFLTSCNYRVHCDRDTWTKHLNEYIFDRSSNVQWFVICYAFTANLLLQNISNAIPYAVSNYFEQCAVMFLLIFGFFTNVLFFTGKLMATYILKKLAYFTYLDKIQSIQLMLSDWNVEADEITQISNYYEHLWFLRRGTMDMPVLYQILPAQVQKNISLDIFWEALKHTHFFANVSISVKKEIAKSMRNEFYLPGYYLCKAEDIKCYLVYIVSGVLQIISEEDNLTPILHLTTGSLIFEINSLLAIKSPVHIRCATKCELHILELTALFRALSKSKYGSKELHMKLNERITNTKKIILFKQNVVKSYETMEEKYMKPMRRLKNNWRMLWLATMKPNDQKLASHLSSIDGTYCFKYLDHLVLYEEVDAKGKAICLTNKFPFVMDPDSGLRRVFYTLSLIAALLYGLILPYNIAFNRGLPAALFTVAVVLDVVYWIDLYMCLITAIRTEYTFITKSTDIMFYRMKEICFLVDLISSIPLDYIVYYNRKRMLVICLKVNRLLKLYKIYETSNKWEESHLGNVLLKRIIKYCILWSFIVYCAICILYIISCPVNCDKAEWRFLTNISSFWICVDWAISLFFSANHTQVVPLSLPAILGCFTVMILGYIILVFCISEWSLAVLQNKLLPTLHYDRLVSLKQLLFNRNLNSFLNKRISYHLTFRWINARYQNDNDVNLNEVPAMVRQSVEVDRIVKAMKEINFFNLFNDDFLQRLAKTSKFKHCQPNSVLCTKGHVSSWIFIVYRGVCRMYSRQLETTEIIKYIGSGTAFPIIEAVYKMPCFITVTTITSVEAIYIPVKTFCILCGVFGAKFVKDIVDTSDIEDFQEIAKPEQTNQDFSIFRKSDYRKELHEEAYQIMGTFKFIKHVLLKKTIPCNGNFYVGWELFKCFIAIVQFFVVSVSFNSAFIRTYFLIQLQFWFDIIGMIDIYIRLHVEYYTKDGILVTHPIYTAKNYMRNSFFLDFITIFPFHGLRCDGILFSAKHKLMGYHFHIMITRSLQMYRLFAGLNYVMKKARGTVLMICGIFVMLLSFLIISLIITTGLLILSCSIDEVTMKHNCSDSRLPYNVTGVDININDIYDVKVLLYHVMILIYSSQSSTLVLVKNTSEIIIVTAIIPMLTLLRYVNETYFISDTVSVNFVKIVNRNKVLNLREFAKRENVEIALIDKLVNEFQYQWFITKGMEVSKDIQIFDHSLQYRILKRCYGDILANTPIFKGEDECFQQLLLSKVRVKHFMKGAKIMQINDVQKYLYIIVKGKVKVSMGDFCMAHLTKGALFGSLVKRGHTRQTIAADASVHTELLYIAANIFDELIQGFPQVHKQVKLARFLNHEYIASELDVTDLDTKSEKSDSAFTASVSISYRAFSNACHSIIYKLNCKLGERSGVTGFLANLFYLHYTPIITMVLMALFILSFTSPTQKNIFYVVSYSNDAIFLFRMLVQLHIRYIDSESGILITNPKLIRKLYVASKNMYLDIFTLFPFEVVLVLMSSRYYSYGLLNRNFRMLFFMKYFSKYKETLNMKTAIKICCLIYLTLFYLVLLFFFWIHISAIEVNADNLIERLAYGSMFAVNLMTSSGSRTQNPTNMQEIKWFMVLNITTPIIHTLLVCAFVNIYSTAYHCQTAYFLKLDDLLANLRTKNLSPALLATTELYCNTIWHSTEGELFPSLLEIAPAYLKEEMMGYIYGKHLNGHFLFSETHIDFLRQLVVHLKRVIYLPGYQIVMQEDNDNCMYFIHSGEIEAKTILPNGEESLYILREGSSFGESSGLFGTSHTATYTCYTVVDALLLNKDSWLYLLKWFPSSKEQILEKATEYQLEGAYRKSKN